MAKQLERCFYGCALLVLVLQFLRGTAIKNNDSLSPLQTKLLKEGLQFRCTKFVKN
jgi:hypothetical protein